MVVHFPGARASAGSTSGMAPTRVLPLTTALQYCCPLATCDTGSTQPHTCPSCERATREGIGASCASSLGGAACGRRSQGRPLGRPCRRAAGASELHLTVEAARFNGQATSWRRPPRYRTPPGHKRRSMAALMRSCSQQSRFAAQTQRARAQPLCPCSLHTCAHVTATTTVV